MRAVVAPASPERLLAAWPALLAFEEDGTTIEVAEPGDLGELLPARWLRTGAAARERPDVALLLDHGPSTWWGALRSGGRRWRRLSLPHPVPALPASRMPLDDRDRRDARERLRRAGLGSGAAVVAIRAFRGTPGPWVELVRAFRREIRDVDVALVVTPDELWTAVRIHERTARAVPVLGAEGGPRELAAVLGEMDAVCGIDDRVLVLARLLGVPALPWSPPRSRWSRRPADVETVLGELRAILDVGSPDSR